MTNAIIVFGGSGFIGTHLLKRLHETHSGSLYSVDISEPRRRLEGVTYITGDVRDLSALSLDVPVDTIYNLAAIHTTPGHENHEYYETNIMGALEVTAFATRHRAERLIFTSSISIYGPSEETKTEESAPAPESAYGRSKLMAEKIHRNWLASNDGNRLVIVRPAVVFGAGEAGNFTRLAKLLKTGFFVYPGRTDTIKACIYVEDLIDAIFAAEAEGDRFVLFNGCYPDQYTISDIVESFRASYFPNARTVTLPKFLLMAGAGVMKPFSATGLGIHPDRILKLVRSTDILPNWLLSKGLMRTGRLPSSLERWNAETHGNFD